MSQKLSYHRDTRGGSSKNLYHSQRCVKRVILRVNSPMDQEQNCWKALVESLLLPSVLMLHFIKFEKVAQLCLTLCDPMDYTVHGIPQARILEWVAIPFSSGSSQPRDRTQVSCIAGRFFTSWAITEIMSESKTFLTSQWRQNSRCFCFFISIFFGCAGP